MITETTKEIILTYTNESNIEGLDMPEINEKVLTQCLVAHHFLIPYQKKIVDFLIDTGHVDLSDDEFGDGYEALSNSVWEFLQKNNL
jgi:hypothetical protein